MAARLRRAVGLAGNWALWLERSRLTARALWRSFGVMLLGPLLMACGDGDNPRARAASMPSSAQSASAYSIKSYLVRADKRSRVDFAPSSYWDNANLAAKTGENIQAKALKPPSQKAQAATKCDGTGGTSNCSDLPIDVQGDAAGQLFDGETLLLAMAGSCVDDVRAKAQYNQVVTKWEDFEDELQSAFDHPGDPNALDVLPHVWDQRDGFPSWFVFPNSNPASVGCDEILAKQEVLLCTANRLVEIADAVTTTTVEFGTDSHWEFPVQALQDQFILRDLALRTLGNLALLETELPVHPEEFGGASFSGLRTCGDIYVRAATLTADEFPSFTYATFNDEGWLELPEPADLGRAHALMVQRANYKTNIFRAAGRMARELLDKSIQADVAGAEKRKADAGDPVQGLQLMWGADPTLEDSKFNSLRHALGTLSGRLDVINPDDPRRRCMSPTRRDGKVDPSGLLEALGPGFPARWDDRPPQTPGQSLALSLLTQAGILLPSEAADADVQAAVTDQLLRNAALARGVPVDTFEAPGGGGDAIRSVLAQVNVQDLRFALDRNFDALRLLTNESESFADILLFAPEHGLTFADPANVSPTVVALNGGVLKGGIPRQDLHIDITGWNGRSQVASQCGASVDPADPIEVATRLGGELNELSPLQNVFTLGQSLSHQLNQMAVGFGTTSGIVDSAATIKNAQAGAAELRTWAGPGTAVLVTDSHDLYFSLLGLRPSDIGAKDAAGMGARLALVKSRGDRGAQLDEQWKADCVAGLRKSCPADLSSLETPFVATVDDIPPYDSNSTPLFAGAAVPNTDLAGLVGPWLSLTVSSTHTIDYTKQDAYVLVERPRSAEQPGRVLVTLLTSGPFGAGPAGDGSGNVRIEAISDYQRTLLNEVFGTGNPARHGSTCGDVTSTAVPDNYCISGMQRDMFVPLSNELTSDGTQQEDSWKHYLSLAQSAAAHADDLGEQVIRAGEERELRREGAQDSLGDVCGTFASVDRLAVTNGDITSDPADAALTACVTPPRVDLVFLTDDKFGSPTNAADEASVDTQIRGAYCPADSAVANPKFCTDKDPNSDDPKKRYITHAALGLKTYVPQTSTSSCDDILALAKTATTASGLDSAAGVALGAIASQPFVSHAGLFAGFGGIQLNVKSTTDSNGHILWEGTRYGKRVLGPSTLFGAGDAAAKEVYPACDAAGVGCTGTAELMRQVFNPTGATLTSTQVRHRIEAALFHLGALVGAVPAETFSVQVPVYNANIDGNPINASQGTEAPAIYSDAKLNTNGSGSGTYYTLAIEAGNPVRDADESVALGHAVPAGAGYWAARKAEDDDAQSRPPIWRKNLYDAAAAATPGTYTVVEGKSPFLMFDKLIQGSDSISRADNIQQWIREFGSDMQNGCRAWPTPGGIPLSLYTYADVFPLNQWNDGSNADRVDVSLQRNVCGSAVNPVFYEDVQSRQLHLRAFAWHAVGGTKAFKDMIEDLDNPGDAMHKEKAAFFEPFSHCAVGPDTAFLPENCLRYNAYTENGGVLLNARGQTPDLISYIPRDSISGDGNFRAVVENRLQPSVCTPGARAELFVNRYPADSCDEAQAIVQGLALACLMSDEPVKFEPGDPPPTVAGLDDLPRYEAWLSMLELQLGDAVNQGYFTDCPRAVLDRNSGANGFTDALGGGAQGSAMLDLADHVEAMHSSWSSLAGAVRDLRSAVKGFRLELLALDNEQQKRELAEHAERLRLTQEIVVNSIQAAASAVEAFVPGKKFGDVFGAAVSGGVAGTNIVYAALQLSNLDDQAAADQDGNKIADDRAAFSFSEQATHTFDTLDQAVIGIRTASNQILTSLNQIASNQQKASWELAKVSGADFAEIDGQPVAQNVNTVLNRQYNVLRIRYEKALEAAKRAAYLARLSIEQRIGVRLGELREPIGPIDAPAGWADDLCSVQGIDYEKLREADPNNPTFDDTSSDTIQTFANQYVGDYVARLQEFIDFYNIEFPFRQADDQAVLSLREDLLTPDAQCSVQSPNELYYSDALFKTGQTDDSFASRQGWQATGCVDDGCMYVKDGNALQDAHGDLLLPPTGVGGISLLKVTDTPPFADPNNGPLGTPTGDPLPDNPAPFGTVYQTVPLRGGHSYILSWWDMARTMTGAVFGTGTPQPYFVGVYDKDWRIIATSSPVASSGGADGNVWSARQELSVTPFADGDYQVVFAPGDLGVRPASLAIANVQLEEPDKNLTSSSTYTRTEASRTIINTECKQVTSEQLRKSFVRRCEGGRSDGTAETCYYELNRDIVFDTEQLDAGFGGLVGKVGRDNYNTRHVDLALNLVGTGLLDCSATGSPSCYGSGFVEYDLQHIAFNAPIIDYNRETHCFDFAEGAVRSGKALAIERYLTLPLSSADESLLAQPAFRKTELFGRPLSGLYKLRIRDNPALVWENLEDIQFLLGYRYWSRVAKPQASR